MYCTVMFFFGSKKHIMVDWAFKKKEEFIAIVEAVYKGARKGKGLVVSPKDYSTKSRY